MEGEVNIGEDLGKLQGSLCCSSFPAQVDTRGIISKPRLPDYHAENTDVGETEDQMAEATIGT
jgi:hypothetical protein